LVTHLPILSVIDQRHDPHQMRCGHVLL
jgi:hypothetical protein